MADYSGKMRKHEAVALDELVKQFIKDMKTIEPFCQKYQKDLVEEVGE